MPKKGSPAVETRGVPEVHLAASKIGPEFINERPLTQAEAMELARVVFGSPPSGAVVGIGNNGLPYWRPA